jgi:hypothetical protein
MLAVVSALTASAASANSLTLGSLAYGSTDCPIGYSFVQQATAKSSPSYRAPYAGTITSWSTTSPNSADAALKVWRPTSHPFKFIPVAESATEPIPGATLIVTFKVSIPVHKGDVIGLAVSTDMTGCLYTTPTNAADQVAYFQGDPLSGAHLTPYGPNSRLNVSATLRSCVVPQLKGKSLTVAKDALADAHCALGNVTKNESNGTAGIVLSQTPKPGTHRPLNSKVALVVSTP